MQCAVANPYVSAICSVVEQKSCLTRSFYILFHMILLHDLIQRDIEPIIQTRNPHDSLINLMIIITHLQGKRTAG